jgi:glutamyl-tRNA synthetase
VDRKSQFLFERDDAVEYDAKAVKKTLVKGDGAGYAMLEALRERLAEQEDWSASALEGFLRGISEEKEVGLGKVAQPLRVATTGGSISPQIFDTIALLGKDRTLARIDRCLALRE